MQAGIPMMSESRMAVGRVYKIHAEMIDSHHDNSNIKVNEAT